MIRKVDPFSLYPHWFCCAVNCKCWSKDSHITDSVILLEILSVVKGRYPRGIHITRQPYWKGTHITSNMCVRYPYIKSDMCTGAHISHTYITHMYDNASSRGLSPGQNTRRDIPTCLQKRRSCCHFETKPGLSQMEKACWG